jgi:hypothetical protein
MADGARAMRRLAGTGVLALAAAAALAAAQLARAHDKSHVPPPELQEPLRPVVAAPLAAPAPGTRSVNSPGGGPAGAPNLYPLLPTEGPTGLQPPVFVDAVTKPGRVLYRFDTVIGNAGGALDLYCVFCNLPTVLVRQHVWASGTPSPDPSPFFEPSGGTSHTLGAQMQYSSAFGHNHWHFQEAARYELLLPDGSSRVTDKIGFCMYDTYGTAPANYYAPDDGPWCFPYNANQQFVHMGISPGRGDFYGAYLEDQWIDVAGLPPGMYTLRATVNPNHLILETTEADNALAQPRVIPGPTAASQSVQTDPGAPLAVTLAGTLVGPEVKAYMPWLSGGCQPYNGACYDDALVGPTNGEQPGPLAFAITDPPDHGTLSAVAPVDGTHATVLYTPAPGYGGPDAFAFTTTDVRRLVSLPGTVTIAVGVPPAASAPPTVTGEARQGATLTAGPGTWTGTPPLSSVLAWQRCDAAGGGCTDVPGAAAAAYVLTAADVGSRLRVRVTTTGAGGTGSAESALTGVVAPSPIKAVPGEPDPTGTAGPPARRLTLRGTARGEVLVGTSANDDIYGRAGRDTLLGLAGRDRLWGGPGNDLLIGGAGRDVLYGGGGNDVLRARGGAADVLTCGRGRDVVIVDRKDRADRSCEVVRRG